MSKDSAYSSGTGHGIGNPTCKQKTLAIGKLVSLAQADCIVPDCQARNLNKEDAMDHGRKLI